VFVQVPDFRSRVGGLCGEGNGFVEGLCGEENGSVEG